MKRRDRRVYKDDFLLPATQEFLETVDSLTDEEAKKFFIHLITMGMTANNAGFKQDGEEMQEKITNSVNAYAAEMKKDFKHPIMAYVIRGVADKIINCTVGYYNRSNQNSLNRQQAGYNVQLTESGKE